MSVRRSGAAVALLVAVVMLSGCATSLSALLGGASRDETGQIDAAAAKAGKTREAWILEAIQARLAGD